MIPIETLHHDFLGALHYLPDYIDRGHELFVGVPCTIEASVRAVALVDTASQWCMLPSMHAEAIGLSLEPDPDVTPLSTRFGLLHGRLERLQVEFTAELGMPLVLGATFFICADWHGPAVIGWKGCLERIRFAVVPSAETFYFGHDI